MGQWSRTLSRLDSQWKEAEVQENAATLPDGEYTVQVDIAKIGGTKKAPDRPMLTLCMIIMNGKHAGRHVYKRYMLDITERFSFLKTDMVNMGVSLECISDIEEHLREIEGVCLTVRLKTNTGNDGKEYQNCYIRELIDTGAVVFQDMANDDLPF